MNIFGFEINRKKQPVNTDQKALDFNQNVSGRYPIILLPGGSGIKNTLQNSLALIDAFNSTPEVYSVVSYMCNALSKVKINIYSGTYDNLGKQILKHDIISLLKEPNYYQSYSEFIRQAFAYWLIDGNIFINAFAPTGMKPQSLYVLPSQFTSIKLFDEAKKDFRTFNDTLVDKYLVEVEKYKLSIDYKNVMHKRNTGLMFSMDKFLFGMSPLLSQKYPINSLLQNYEAQCSIISNRGAMGIISAEKSEMPINSLNKSEIQDQYIETYGLSENQYKVIISQMPIKYQRIGMDIGELKLNETNVQNYRAVCRALAFPSMILNDIDNAKYENVTAGEKQLWSNNLVPLFDDFCNDLTVFLNQWYPDVVLMPDYSKIDSLQKDKKGICEALNYQFDRGIITPDEYRIELGLEPINTPEMNKRYIAGNYKPIDNTTENSV